MHIVANCNIHEKFSPVFVFALLTARTVSDPRSGSEWDPEQENCSSCCWGEHPLRFPPPRSIHPSPQLWRHQPAGCCCWGRRPRGCHATSSRRCIQTSSPSPRWGKVPRLSLCARSCLRGFPLVEPRSPTTTRRRCLWRRRSEWWWTIVTSYLSRFRFWSWTAIGCCSDRWTSGIRCTAVWEKFINKCEKAFKFFICFYLKYSNIN